MSDSDSVDNVQLRKLCERFLGKTWLGSNADTFRAETLSKGFSNRLYLCGDNKDSARKVLVRLYGGNVLPSNPPLRTLTEASEVLVAYVAHKMGLGPEVYGVFEGGRVEQFIPSKSMTLDEFQTDQKAVEAIARIVARYHSLNVPVDKEPINFLTSIGDCMAKFLEIKDHLPPMPAPETEAEGLEMMQLMTFDFMAEIGWLQMILPQIKTRIVFAHNDLNRSNILLRDGADSLPMDNQLVLVDFEYSGYNYRGFDIGNYFAMRYLDLGGQDLTAKNRIYPDEQQRRQFIRAYIEECSKLAKFDQWDQDGADSEESILLESEFFCLVAMLQMQAWVMRDIVWFMRKAAMMKQQGTLGVSPAVFVLLYKERKRSFLQQYPQFNV